MAQVKYRGVAFEWGGRTLVVPNLPIGELRQLTAHIANIETPVGTPVNGESATGLVFDRIVQDYTPIVCAALNMNYPGMSEEEVLQFLALDNFAEVYRAAIGTTDKEKTNQTGEPQPVELPSPASIGTKSTGA